VGTTSLCGTVMALTAVLLNIAAEQQWVSLLGEQATFLAAAWLGIVIVLPFSTRLAARLHARHSEAVLRPVLRMLFAGLSVLMLLAACIAALSR